MLSALGALTDVGLVRCFNLDAASMTPVAKLKQVVPELELYCEPTAHSGRRDTSRKEESDGRMAYPRWPIAAFRKIYRVTYSPT